MQYYLEYYLLCNIIFNYLELGTVVKLRNLIKNWGFPDRPGGPGTERTGSQPRLSCRRSPEPAGRGSRAPQVAVAGAGIPPGTARRLRVTPGSIKRRCGAFFYGAGSLNPGRGGASRSLRRFFCANSRLRVEPPPLSR